MRYLTVVCLALSLCSSLAIAGATPTSYHIGNSLTVDANPWTLNQVAPGGLSVGSHIRCGSSMDGIWSNPGDTCLTSPAPWGTFSNALPNFAWNYVTIQSYYGDTLNGASGVVTRVNDFINLARTNPANAGTRFFLYSAWPATSADYSAAWGAPYTGAAGSEMTRDFFWQASAQLQSQHGGSFALIPVGDVVAELDQRMRNSLVPGFTSAADLYRDSIHFNEYGQYVAFLTHYATMFQTSPVGLPVPSVFTQGSAVFSPALVQEFQETVWAVVSTHPYTNVPEPGAIALIGLAIPALLARRRAS
jgi:hypothetical protein